MQHDGEVGGLPSPSPAPTRCTLHHSKEVRGKGDKGVGGRGEEEEAGETAEAEGVVAGRRLKLDYAQCCLDKRIDEGAEGFVWEGGKRPTPEVNAVYVLPVVHALRESERERGEGEEVYMQRKEALVGQERKLIEKSLRFTHTCPSQHAK